MKKITLELTDEQVNSLINGEEVVVLQSSLIKDKSELDIMKEKFESGKYICVRRNNLTEHEYIFKNESAKKHGFNVIKNDWYKVEKISKYPIFEHKLIHKKDIDVLDAYLKDNSVKIEYEIDVYNGEKFLKTVWNNVNPNNWIDTYKEIINYSLKQQYPVFKRNEDGMIFMLDNNDNKWWCVFGDSYDMKAKWHKTPNWESIPYNEERGLYHKQPVWCWDNNITISKGIYFYDVVKNCVFDQYQDGVITSNTFDNIEPITPDQLKTMPFIWDMYKQLKDKKG